MASMITIGAFAATLIACVAAGVKTIYALMIGYGIFLIYGVSRGFSAAEVVKMSVKGVLTVKNILIVFVVIGMVTGLWRAAGTIPAIICYASGVIVPEIFLPIAFLLNCLVSFMTGTSFGSAATMGVISVTMGIAMGISPVLLGGAMLSGIMFGDRASPVSSSANLVAELTKTDLYKNIGLMMKSAAVPFVLTVFIYFVLGQLDGGTGEMMNVTAIFENGFVIHPAAVFPAVLVLILSVFRLGTKRVLAVTAAVSFVIAVGLQHISPLEAAKIAVFGYHAENPELAKLIDGGGIVSMMSAVLIVGLSSSYSGIFDGTGLLDGIKDKIGGLAGKLSPFGATWLVSIFSSMIACNQTLATILTHQLCSHLEPDRQKFAIWLENTAVLMAELIPWSIAGAIPLQVVGAPPMGMAFAVYLVLVPAWQVTEQTFAKRNNM
ncbi:MAG: sodium:proton antiporter [Clostridium sp.]|nr:sodium:proton antiporter [Clostridium sp.]